MNLDFLKKITGGLFLLTTEFNGIKNGCIINNCMEVSTNPSCISISVMKNSYTNELIEKSKKFAISILNKDVSSEMVKKFELFSGRKNDKFQNISTVMDKNNVPYVTKNVSTVISANVISKFDLGTHTLFIAQVIDINDINNSKPITYDEYQKNVVLKEKIKHHLNILWDGNVEDVVMYILVKYFLIILFVLYVAEGRVTLILYLKRK